MDYAYRQNIGPKQPLSKAAPGPESLEDEPDWINKEAVELMERTSELLHMLHDVTQISIPLFVNPCPIGLPNITSPGGCPTMY
jgi:hypothetical protein